MQNALATQVGRHAHVTRSDDIPERERILNALSVWIKQRPGLEYGNYASYGDNGSGRAAYFAEVRSITRDLHDARELLNAVALRPSIGAPELREAFRAYSGRLMWKVVGQCRFCDARDESEHTRHTSHAFTPVQTEHLDYCTGQYWPTEYRRAVCAVLRSALRDYWRAYWADNSAKREAIGAPALNIGDCIRGDAKRELSRGVYARWFRDA